MDFLTLATKRRSVRKFKQQTIETEKLGYILKCISEAPSAVNYQPWYFYIVNNENIKKQIFQSYPREWFSNAPTYIVACVNIDQSWKRKFDNKDHADIDIAIAVEHLCLAATEQGLGTCWVCNFEPNVCSKALDLPKNKIPVVIIPIGYPEEEEFKKSTRKPIDDICIVIN